MGLVSDAQWSRFEARRARFLSNSSRLLHTQIRIAGTTRVAAELIRQPTIRLADLIDRGDVVLELEDESRELDVASVETAVKYEGYLKQEAARVARASRQERRRIPEEFPFARVPGLSREAVQRLSQVRPETLGQASRIPGITPAAIAVLGAFIGRLSPETLSENAM
jgi:tRNA uridine 5-carboxymethylaminomethyl modification enzyme